MFYQTIVTILNELFRNYADLHIVIHYKLKQYVRSIFELKILSRVNS